jgi:hypothetical protein
MSIALVPTRMLEPDKQNSNKSASMKKGKPNPKEKRKHRKLRHSSNDSNRFKLKLMDKLISF